MSDNYNTADYIELTIKCLFRDRAVLSKALDLQVRPADFGTINIYNAFAEAALSIGTAPISPQLCLMKVKELMPKYSILSADKPAVATFCNYIYEDATVDGEYVLKNLAEFIKFRRFQAIKLNNLYNPEAAIQAAKELVGDIELKASTGKVRVFKNFFTNPVLIEHKDSLMTGFPNVDNAAKGLSYQEMGIILGHSGSGKTAMAIFSAIKNAKDRRKVLYLSLEEPGENIVNRAYSNIFRISYSDLHKGSVLIQQDLKEAMSKLTPEAQQTLNHLQIHDLRDATPITAGFIENYLDKLYLETGYHPDVVYIDQMDYLTTNEKYDAEWQKYAKVSFEVDALCNHLIGEKHMFAVWLLHQASGKMNKTYTNAEISGFKGVLKPADMVLAIGRESPQDTVVNIFSIKSRHAKNFCYTYLAELEFMNFEEHDAAAEERAKEETEDKRKERKGNYENIPRKTKRLPKPGEGFLAP